MGNASGISVYAHCTRSTIEIFYKKKNETISYFQILICCKIHNEKNLTPQLYVRYELYMVWLLPFYDETVGSLLLCFEKVNFSVLLFIKLRGNIFAVNMAREVVTGQSVMYAYSKFEFF